MRHQRGSLLIETIVAVAIGVALSAIAIGLASASLHPAPARVAAAQFDASLAYARGLAASSGNGATILVTGGALTVYAGRPTAAGALSPGALAPAVLGGTQITVSGVPPGPVALFVAGSGGVRAAAFTGPTPAPMPAEPACPAQGFVSLSFADARTAVTRSLPC